MANSTGATVAGALLDISALRYVPDAPLTLRSGICSPVYVDNRRLNFTPATMAQRHRRLMRALICEEALGL